MKLKHLIQSTLALAAALTLSSCINDDLPECPNDYRLKIVFDRNMLYADAFASQVKSVDIKVFDRNTGLQVYSHSESGEALQAEGYTVALPIPAGQYDILCWGSMAEGDSFSLNPDAEALEHHSVTLRTDNGLSSSRLNNLYHGLVQATFIDNNTIGSTATQTVTMSLTKDTNRLNVVLHNLDGTEMTDDAFTFSITSHNGEMSYDNTLSALSKVTYQPWHVAPIMTEFDDTRAGVQASLAAEFVLARLTDDSNSRLDVYRTSDGQRIISVPLERNLLLHKGHFHANMPDQEYLDRQDDFTITFILDKNNNWDRAAMIYINDWATLPIQYTEW